MSNFTAYILLEQSMSNVGEGQAAFDIMQEALDLLWKDFSAAEKTDLACRFEVRPTIVKTAMKNVYDLIDQDNYPAATKAMDYLASITSSIDTEVVRLHWLVHFMQE